MPQLSLRPASVALAITLPMALASAVARAQGVSASGGGGGGGGGGAAGKNAFIGGVSGLFLKDESTQGDRDLAGGQTVFTYTNLQYNMPKYFSGVGFVLQRNSLGTSQTDTHYGVKGELFWSEYYLEVAYCLVTQSFEGRSIDERTGTETTLGLGRRVPILGGRMHFDLSVKQRSASIETEDGNDLPDPIQRTTLLPYLGLGTSL